MSSYSFLRAAITCTALVVAVAAPASAQKKVNTTGLPAGWAAHALGSELGEERILVDQSVSVENGVWTVTANGFDLWTENDGGLIVYMKQTGDGHASFRLLSQEGGHTDGWVKTAAGFRESLAPDSRDVHISYTSSNSLEPAIRVNAAETPKHPNDADSGFIGFNGNGSDDVPRAGRQLDGKPIWVGIDRQGNNFGFYYSEDGKVWTSIGNGNIEFPAEMFAGIEASAHNDASDPEVPSQVSKLDNVEVNSELLRTRSIANLQIKGGSGQALITWNPVAASVGDVTYNVYSINPGATERTKLNTDPIKEGSFTATGLTNGTEYRFGVTAVVGGVESGLQVQFSPEEGSTAVPPVTPG